jgi:DNA replication and repair protein RecF
MSLARLQVTDLRCLQRINLDLDPRFTLISGANGSGKTSLLEAIHVLGRGRSFRTARVDHLIRRGQQRFIVFGEVESAGLRTAIGVEGETGRLRAQVSGTPVTTLAELSLALPVQVIDPEVHKLIEDGPVYRRRFLDWGVFHVEHSFLLHWRRYRQVLKQRNAALRTGQSRELISLWDEDLTRSGEAIDAARRRYLEGLRAEAAALVRGMLDRSLELGYQRGWGSGMTLREALEAGLPLDCERGTTGVGPHRADLRVKVDGQLAKDHVSRGQQKLLAAALLIAQIKLFPTQSHGQPSLLLDDPSAELDTLSLAKLLEHLAGGAQQLVVTTLNDAMAGFGSPGVRIRLDSGRVHAG